MDLKGFRLWAMGQLEATCRAAPPRRIAVLADPFEKANFETKFFYFIGPGVETNRSVALASYEGQLD
jgi:hypothetical protein